MNAAPNRTAEAVTFAHPRTIEPEDQVRADFYALLASLFYRAPAENLLRAIVVSAEPGSDVPDATGDSLASAWAALAAASGVVSGEAVEEEYEAVFVGVGRAPVMLFGSYYVSGFMNEKPLAELRSDLAALGFARDRDVTEPEDHLAALCDVMRAMIQGDVAAPPASLAQQAAFFARHMQPWVINCCGAIVENGKSNYYKRVAAFARAFFEIEIQAFAM